MILEGIISVLVKASNLIDRLNDGLEKVIDKLIRKSEQETL